MVRVDNILPQSTKSWHQAPPCASAGVSLRSPRISAVSALSGFDFLSRLLRLFLRASASPRQDPASKLGPTVIEAHCTTAHDRFESLAGPWSVVFPDCSGRRSAWRKQPTPRRLSKLLQCSLCRIFGHPYRGPCSSSRSGRCQPQRTHRGGTRAAACLRRLPTARLSTRPATATPRTYTRQARLTASRVGCSHAAQLRVFVQRFAPP